MAKFMSTILSAISGSVNGVTFSRNRSGSYMRNHTIPVNKKTDLQTAVRNAFGAISSLWRTLTEATRDAFGQLASTVPYVDSLGQSKSYSGFQMFKKLYGMSRSFTDVAEVAPIAPLSFAATAPPAFLPVLLNFDPSIAFAVVVAPSEGMTPAAYDSAGFALVAEGLAAPSNQYLQVQITRPYSPGKTFLTDKDFVQGLGKSPSTAVTKMNVTLPISNPDTQIDFETPLQEIIPADDSFIGKKMTMRCRIVDPLSGWAGQWLSLSTIIQSV